MARGGISFEGIGFQAATFKAGDGIKALVAAANKDAVVGVPVVVTSAGDVVDLGNDGDIPFGLIDVYEDDGHCTVQFRGFRTDVPTVVGGVVAGRIFVVDGNGVIKDSSSGIGVKQKMTKAVTAAITNADAAGTVTVTVKAAGKAELADGKAVAIELAGTDTTTTKVATAIQAALAADADVAAFFNVTRSTTSVVLEAKVEAANDATMAFTFADTDTTGAAMGDTAVVNGQADRKIGLPTIINADATAKTATVSLG